MKKITDIIADRIVKLGIKNVYAITGGAVMHLLDSFKKKKINLIFCHHEQAALLAATSEARINNSIGCAVVTQGPGVTNAITGLAAAWFDSIPCLIFSGQARSDLFSKKHFKVRQLAPQSFQITKLIESLSNEVYMPNNLNDFCKNFENKLLQLNSSRPGPVWIDLPVDIQWSKIDSKKILKPKTKKKKIIINKKKYSEFIRLIKESSKPLILIGSAIKLSESVKIFKKFYKINKIPLISSWNASDILDNNEQLYIGRPGIFGQRGANYIIQKCDLLICLGTGLGAGLTTYNFKDFGRNAKKIFINNDTNELNASRFKIHLKWNVDVKILLEHLTDKKILSLDKKWEVEAKKIKKMNFYEFKRDFNLKNITDPYFFCDQISKLNKNKKTIFCVDGGGIITQVAPQMLNLSNKHKLNISAGLCTMGCLPEALGAKIAKKDHEVIFLTGDGSLMMNLQELQTIKHYKKNIKIFVLSNNTYGLMMMAQKAFFNKNYVGSSNASGVSFPDLKKISDVFDFDYFKILNNKDLLKKLPKILKNKKRLICEIIISKEFKMNPAFSTRVSKGKKIQATLDSMEPYLNQEEII